MYEDADAYRLGVAFPYDGIDFGMRVNAGGTLAAEGSPTNLVVLARLNLVQEAPEPCAGSWWTGWQAPLLAARAIGAPLPEIRLRFADLPASAGDYRVYAPQLSMWPSVQGEQIASLQVQDCLVRGGVLCYESGFTGPRDLTLRNSLFERATVWVADYHFSDPGISEQLIAHNNLFYGGIFHVKPCVGNTWTVIDNIFHGVELIEEEAPDVRVANHHHNAYVAMSSALSSATSPNPGDTSLAALNYVSGSLGRFYLPASATQLLNAGSRPAAQAGLVHYTSFTNQVKAGAITNAIVNLGLHYVALVNGQPADSDTDGFPDYVEDAGGNGLPDAGESNWQVRETTPVQVLGFSGSPTVSGVFRVPVQFDNPNCSVLKVGLIDDAGNALPGVALTRPFSGPLEIEVDSRKLPNGSLTFKAEALLSADPAATQYSLATSEPVTVTVNNDVLYPDWSGRAGEETAMLAFGRSSPFAYGIAIYDSDYPYMPFPQPIDWLEGQSNSSGNVAQAWTPIGDAYEHPVFFPFVYSYSNGQYLVPSTSLPVLIPSIPYPEAGAWYVAYEEPRVFEPFTGAEYAMTDPLQPDAIHTWFHDGVIPGWLGVAAWSNPPDVPAPVYFYPPDPSRRGQTWPIRMEACYQIMGNVLATGNMRDDWRLFKNVAISPLIRNLYVRAHMSDCSVGLLGMRELSRIRHRYRFAFFDGCNSVHGGTEAQLPQAFGFVREELFAPMGLAWYLSDPRHLRPAGGVAMRYPIELYVLSIPPLRLGEIPAELCQFYIEFQSNWTMRGNRLKQALDGAITYAKSLPTQLQHPPWGGPPGGENAKVIGYMNLRHSEYNLSGAW